jgi:hypothetical protein
MVSMVIPLTTRNQTSQSIPNPKTSKLAAGHAISIEGDPRQKACPHRNAFAGGTGFSL